MRKLGEWRATATGECVAFVKDGPDLVASIWELGGARGYHYSSNGLGVRFNTLREALDFCGIAASEAP